MATRMQQRRGTAEQWTLANPVLAGGELGVETDTYQFKIGDGVNTWSSLDYFSAGVDLSAYATESYVDSENVSQTATITAAYEAYADGATTDMATTTYVDDQDVATLAAANSYTDGEIAALVDSSPATLDTLNELAAALGDDANFATTVTNSLSEKKKEISSAISANTTAEAGYRYFVNTASAVTVTLPATPSLGDEVQIFDAAGSASTNNITVNNNGNNINGQNDTALLDVDGVAAVFIYTGSTYGWRMG